MYGGEGWTKTELGWTSARVYISLRISAGSSRNRHCSPGFEGADWTPICDGFAAPFGTAFAEAGLDCAVCAGAFFDRFFGRVVIFRSEESASEFTASGFQRAFFDRFPRGATSIEPPELAISSSDLLQDRLRFACVDAVCLLSFCAACNSANLGCFSGSELVFVLVD